MRLDHSLQLRMQQKMILAPNLYQSMEILTLPAMELTERIQEELQENPVLALKEEEKKEGEPIKDSPSELKQEADAAYEEYTRDYDDDAPVPQRRSRESLAEEGDRKLDAMQNTPDREQSLQDVLMDQINLLEASPERMRLLEHFVVNLKDNGWLPPLKDVLESYGIPVTETEAEEALAQFQSLEPAGVGARNAVECLLLQVTSDMPHADIIRNLITHHLDDIAANRIPQIQKRTGLSTEIIHEVIDTIKHQFNPRPSAGYASKNVGYVVPDLNVTLNEAGEFEVTLIRDYTPEVFIPRRYKERIRDPNIDPKEKEYLKKKIQAAEWFVEAIEQRKQTLIKVTRCIMEKQRDFFIHGAPYIHPLKMQQIAEEIPTRGEAKKGVHVTTISRAVDEKWVQTPRGMFPLKRFFGGGTTNAEGEEVSYEQIRVKINELINSEDKANPYSDDELVKKLDETGLKIARRTVTKYRMKHNIPSSRQRKNWTERVG